MPIAPSLAETAELRLASREVAGRPEHELELVVPEIHCAGCMTRIEDALSRLPHVTGARVNLSTKRVRVRWRGDTPPPLLEKLAELGFSAHAIDAQEAERDDGHNELLRATAVAGFAAMNIMLLSVSIWSGADSATRQMFHWISALIALPALAYSGRVFFRSAWRSLRHGQANMDVPISIGVLAAFGLSLHETIVHGQHAYFDASVTLVFFLLVGRTLERSMRDRSRSAVRGLARLAARGATVVEAGGSTRYLKVDEIRPGMMLRIGPGERTPVNARVCGGRSDVDVSLLTGESAPASLGPGDELWAGTLNLTTTLDVEAVAEARDSFLAQMMRMMEAAESGRSTYRRIADRAARLYAPVVHLAALLSLAAWWLGTGDFHRAITVAIAVLIITCPCALGLAVPMVHVAAARRLFANGIMVRDGAGLEKLAGIDTVVFDKTGTLTQPQPQVAAASAQDSGAMSLAAALARHSRHPFAQAIAHHATPSSTPFEAVHEQPGCGIEGRQQGAIYRLGAPAWAGHPSSAGNDDDAVLFTRDGNVLARFVLATALRPDAIAAIAALRRSGLQVEMLSGDHAGPVEAIAAQLGIPAIARVTPSGKAAHVSKLEERGSRVLMVGDGLNDGPALVSAHVSMAPATAADVGRNAASFVFLRQSLMAVPEAIRTARRAAVIVQQNLVLAVAYNAIAVPIAIAGHVTPLIAAIAMSLSSFVVVANSLRVGAA